MGRDPERNKIPRNNLWTGHAARASLASDKTAIMRRWQPGRKTPSDGKPSPEKLPPGKHGHPKKHGGGLLGQYREKIGGRVETRSGIAGAVAI
jgi:hypothetical protein